MSRPTPTNRRDFLKQATAVGALASLPVSVSATAARVRPVAIATWDNRRALEAAWVVLGRGGYALDAVEQGVHVPEADPNDHSVGLGGHPDRDGRVTLDSCIMDERFRCGSVAAIEDIVHPVSVARKVMEETPHVMLVGEGAKQFALEQGFEETNLLTEQSEREWRAWTEENNYRPAINNERPDWPGNNHDTCGMLAIDAGGRLSGACTTSGWAYKLRGRVGDSPIIGAGLYVDGEIGAATATGHGEEMIRMAAAHSIVELMRGGLSPQEACQQAVERIRRHTPTDPSTIQAGLLALDEKGDFGGFALQSGFNYVVALPDTHPEPTVKGEITDRVQLVDATIYLVEAPSLL
ncbi:MAG: N(4)-(beta-N-acetylglucosaminyl)-L-asparaginase [Rubricoccaceae bacterium]|nr:N(4)-(beta-N-acetylglucosaminyl)-L-asparaginase [Rubricoccaceae bacterium]